MTHTVIASEARQSRAAKTSLDCFVATLLAMTAEGAPRSPNYLTTPEVNPAFRRGGLMSFFRKQCASLPA